MEPDEYERMARVEASHWWYAGLRDLLGRTLARPELGLPAHPRVLDAGCGTGETLRLLRRQLAPAYLGGFDSAPAALHHARAKEPEADLYESDLRDPVLHVETLDLVVCADVVYVPGLASCREGLRRLVAHLRPGGLFVLHVPALRWLHGEHDLAVHTRERYRLAEIRDLLATLGLDVNRASYRLCFLLPVIAALRVPGIWRVRRGRGRPRSDLARVPPAAANRLLAAILRAENALLLRGARLPFGSSIFAVGRRP